MRERFIRWLIRILKVKGVHLHRDPIRKQKDDEKCVTCEQPLSEHDDGECPPKYREE